MAQTNPLVLKLRQSGVLTEEDYGPLADLCATQRFVKAGATLVEEGQRLEGVPLVLDGFAYRYRLLPDGKRQILGILLPGDFCDIQGAILGRSDHFTAAATDCLIVWFPREIIDDLTLTRSRIARALWWAALVDGCVLRAWLTSMGQLSADRWLAHLFCEFLLRLQVVGHADANSCAMPFTQEKLADIIGVTSIHINRILQDLRDQGLIELGNKRLTIPNVKKLWSYCSFAPDYLHLNAGETFAAGSD